MNFDPLSIVRALTEVGFARPENPDRRIATMHWPSSGMPPLYIPLDPTLSDYAEMLAEAIDLLRHHRRNGLAAIAVLEAIGDPVRLDAGWFGEEVPAR